ncbi:flagellar basal body rod protein FlgB [Halobacillus salinarum]|uniref:Flagellar basal body rod protein FlgB n=1 Tax=Halobacillus salinarum TaxID=2932257 RepID=A0ABY4EF09_9BACI|nr:flagellar basal body rod protein FlgB [Halobacillus salinarum]UOQ43059.1 flagellar basal body rod protein FlgB [Halobacillus salinarum]
MKLFGNTIQSLEHSLNYAAAKNNAIADNIANADTPGYKAKKVVFKDELQKELGSLEAKRTSPKHLPFQAGTPSSFSTIEQKNTTYNHNGNNVDIDQEMSELAKNQIYYDALIDRLNGKFRTLETVIKGGR